MYQAPGQTQNKQLQVDLQNNLNTYLVGSSWFAVGETEAQRGLETCVRAYSCKLVEQGYPNPCGCASANGAIIKFQKH